MRPCTKIALLQATNGKPEGVRIWENDGERIVEETVGAKGPVRRTYSPLECLVKTPDVEVWRFRRGHEERL